METMSISLLKLYNERKNFHMSLADIAMIIGVDCLSIADAFNELAAEGLIVRAGMDAFEKDEPTNITTKFRISQKGLSFLYKLKNDEADKRQSVRFAKAALIIAGLSFIVSVIAIIVSILK